MLTHGSRSRKVVGTIVGLLLLAAALFLLFAAVPLNVDWMLKVIIWIIMFVYAGFGFAVLRWGFQRTPAAGGVRVR